MGHGTAAFLERVGRIPRPLGNSIMPPGTRHRSSSHATPATYTVHRHVGKHEGIAKYLTTSASNMGVRG